MKQKTILITGGAGFIGSFLADGLVAKKHNVIIFDSLEPQVHNGKKPKYLHKKARFVKGDVRDYKQFHRVLKQSDVVFHLASRVGVGQANYQIKDYTDVNVGGMANLLDIVVNKKTNVRKIIMTASMTGYGEGLYTCEVHGMEKPSIREDRQMKKKQWDFRCSQCKKIMIPVATSESTPMENKGIYALSKKTQEDMLLGIGKMYGIPSVSLRLFNVYGPRQSLSNPYTGVSAIFISRMKNNKAPVIYEDGKQSRDFVSVHDVVAALLLAMDSEKANYQAINIGSGHPVGIEEIALRIAGELGVSITPRILNDGRKGDIRHCFADIKKAKRLLKWKPQVTFSEGLRELIAWSNNEQATDAFEKATSELSKKRLMYE